ncbi:MAG: cation transporter [Kofleriaceae bacterium]|nr:cation transporter [Kofleriaceae bacterium]
MTAAAPEAPNENSQAQSRSRQVRNVLLIELFFNLLVAGAKAIFGVLSGSLSITADAVHSGVDASANIVGLVVLHKAEKPPDDKHPYGHRKLEVLAASILGISIAAVGFGLALRSIDALLSGATSQPPQIAGVLVILGTLTVNIFVASYEARKAKELKSTYLAADAAHTASDVLVTLAVLVSYVANYWGIGWADSIGALVVVAILFKISWTVISQNLFVLLDQAKIDDGEILTIVLGVPGVVDCHRIRSRGLSDEIIMDLHVHADGEISLLEAHHISHEVESALRKHHPEISDITIHMEPAGDPHETL